MRTDGEKKNQVKLFDLTALFYVFFPPLLCFEWNCFSFSLACFLLKFVHPWFLWNFVNYSRSSWRHYKKKSPCLLLDLCVSSPALGLKNYFSPKFVRIGSVSPWTKIRRKKKKEGKQSVDLPASTGSMWKWINQAPSPCPSPLWSRRLHMPNIHLTLTERISPLRLSLIRLFHHFLYVYRKKNSR